MIKFKDIFNEKFLTNFVNNISLSTVAVTLGVAVMLAFFVFFIYKLTTKSMIYSRKFNVTMSLMSVITAAVVLSMQANIVVSLGMVGALSIVRFRTAIKEPRDLLFLFWSISNGIIIGANIYSIAFMLSIVLTIAMLVFDLLPEKKLPCLLVINCDGFNTEKKIFDILKKNKIKYIVKSRNVETKKLDLLLEVNMDLETQILETLNKVKGISSLNLISQDGEGQY